MLKKSNKINIKSVKIHLALLAMPRITALSYIKTASEDWKCQHEISPLKDNTPPIFHFSYHRGKLFFSPTQTLNFPLGTYGSVWLFCLFQTWIMLIPILKPCLSHKLFPDLAKERGFKKTLHPLYKQKKNFFKIRTLLLHRKKKVEIGKQKEKVMAGPVLTEGL